MLSLSDGKLGEGTESTSLVASVDSIITILRHRPKLYGFQLTSLAVSDELAAGIAGLSMELGGIRLDSKGAGFTNVGIASLMSSTLSELTLSNVRGSFTPEAVVAIAQSRHAHTSKSLSLFSPDIDSSILETVAESPLANQLALLSISKYSGRPPSRPLSNRDTLLLRRFQSIIQIPVDIDRS